MSTISGVSGGTSAAWSEVSAARAARKENLFAKLDADGSGAVDATELQGLLDKVADKTGTTAQKASDVLAKLDTDGNGTLDKSELKAGIKSLLPAPGSTQDFAAQHVPTGSDPISKAPTFEQLDTDGDGTISKAEFAAGTAQASTDVAPSSDARGTEAPSGPPPSGGAGGASATSDSSNTTYDPLDTNKDGVVSAQEQAAGDLKNVLADLLKAIDTNGDKKISESEVDTFQKNVTAALQSLSTSGISSSTSTTATSATSSSSTSSDASSSSSNSASTGTDGSTSDGSTTGVPGHHHRDFSLSAFASLVLKQYAATASDASSVGGSISVSA